MTEQQLAAAGALNEEAPPEADQQTEFDWKLELDRNKLQVQNEGRQLGYLLVQKTKGETQLQVRRWIQSTNGWEAWRQLNLLHSTSKRSTHFKLLSSLMSPSFDAQPASFLQQFNAWKEQVVRYQQLSGENLPDFIKLTAVVNGLKGQVRHHVLMQLDGGSSFGDLDSLLQKYFNNTYVQSESSLNSVWDKAWRDNQAKEQKGKNSKGKGKKLNPHYKQEGAKGKSKGKGKGKGKPSKGKGEAYPSQPASYKGKGKQQQLPKNQQWCSICFKKGHLAQACWWNPDPYQQQNQHQKGAAWPTKGQQQSFTSLGPATTLASTNFSSVAWRVSVCSMAWRTSTSASALQSEPTSHLHQLTTRQPIHVELGTTVTSFDPTGAFSTCLYHSYAEEKLPAFQQSFEDMGHLG